jgi:hypothetical protein
MSRLYLTDNERYRVRQYNSVIVVARWDDSTMRFVATTMRGEKVVPTDFIGAVAAFTNDRRGTIKWTPLDECYREKHRESKKIWTHPYRVRTLPLGVTCG